MLGVGWTEMLVIGVIALIVIGPKDLPVVMRRIGQFAGTIRRMGSEFQREINKTTGLDEIRSLRTSITAPLKQTSEEIRREFNAMTPTGVKPSGAIRPADPKAESVVDEIHAAAGLKPLGATTEKPVLSEPAAVVEPPITSPGVSASPEAVAASDTAAEVKKVPVKAKRVVRAKPAPSAPVTVGALEPLAEAEAQKPKRVAIRKSSSKASSGAVPPGGSIVPAPEASVLVKKPSTRQKAVTEPKA